MQIFGTDSYRTKISTSLTNSKDIVSLISAYITIEGIEWVLDKIDKNVNCRVLTRWKCNDLISGASDIEIFDKLQQRGYALYILSDLHAKVTVIDKRELFLGSANVTNSGLKLVPAGNREIGTVLAPDKEDLGVIDALFEEGIYVTENLYQKFRQELSLMKEETDKLSAKRNWSSSLLNELKKTPERIWVTETLWCNSPEDLIGNSINLKANEVIHDLALLGFDASTVGNLTLEELGNNFIKSRVWNWLIGQLNSVESKELYYGKMRV